MNSLQMSPLFPINSRYYSTNVTKLVTGHREIPYLLRRFLPSTDQFTTIRVYTVTEGDRLDNVAASTLGDPLAFWRICDANGAMRPEELTATPGSLIQITLPQGLQGASVG